MNMQRLLDTGWKLAVILCASVLMLAAFRSPQSTDRLADEVRARKFVLVDAGGKTLGEWGPDSEGSSGTSLILYNPDHLSEAITLRVADGVAGLEIRGGWDNGKVMLSTDKASSSLLLFDNCLKAPCNGGTLSCRARISVAACSSELRLEQASTEHTGNGHFEGNQSILVLPDTKAGTNQQRGK